MSEAEIREGFQIFDHNGDGIISRAELHAVLVEKGGTSEQEFDEIVSMFDTDGSGSVSVKEFENACLSMSDEQGDELAQLLEQVAADRMHAKTLHDAFAVFDENGDGSISSSEMRAVLSRSVPGAPVLLEPSEVDALIAEFDADDSGTLSLHEFAQACGTMGDNEAEQVLRRVTLTKRQRALAAQRAQAAAERAEERRLEQARAAAEKEAADSGVSKAGELRDAIVSKLEGGDDLFGDEDVQLLLLQYQLCSAVGHESEGAIPEELLSNRALLETFLTAGDCRSTRGHFGGVIWHRPPNGERVTRVGGDSPPESTARWTKGGGSAGRAAGVRPERERGGVPLDAPRRWHSPHVLVRRALSRRWHAHRACGAVRHVQAVA
jgi:calcium-binding protein CML